MFPSTKAVLLAGIIGTVACDAAVAQVTERSESKKPQDRVERLLQAIATGEKLEGDASPQLLELIAVVEEGEHQESDLAIRALAAMKSRASAAVVAISKKLSDPDHATRSAAALALVAIGDDAVVPLRKLLNSSTARTRAAATQALGRLKRLDVGDAARLSRDSDPRVRFASMDALTALGDRSLPRLAHMVEDPEYAVSVEACCALSPPREEELDLLFKLSELLARKDPAIAAPQDSDYVVRASARGSEWRGTPQEWTCSTGYGDIKDYADRPNEPTLGALSVEWQKPELDALGNLCTLRGQLKMRANGQKHTQPVTWFQGVTVYIGTTPGAQPDWSQAMSQADTVYETAVTSPSGKFRVCFDLRKTKCDRAHIHSLQFGIALAKHIVNSKTSHNVIWSSRAPAIGSTVQMLSVPAAQALSRELELINRASRWPFSDPDGVEIIRAVNALQPLGKKRALAILEEYVELTRSFEYFSEPEIVFWIIRLLFEPIRLEDRIPSPAIAVFLDDRQSVEAMKWPLNPMAVSGGIPFMVGGQVSMSGRPELPSSHIRWAELQGVIRDDLLVPTTNPLAAAEAILGSRRFKALDNFSRVQGTREIRSQALAMVDEMLEPNSAHAAADHDDGWRACVRAAAERGIHWDAKREQFVSQK
jgi:hypothetical protein